MTEKEKVLKQLQNFTQYPNERQLFVFWQFNGDNKCACQLHCPECYGRKQRTGLHYWNGKIVEWERAFESLNRDIYFVFSYGEALISKGFYECVDMIGQHPTWTLNIITNLIADPKRLLETQLCKEHRLFIIPCWHPEGVDDPIKGWEIFKEHLLMLKAAGVPTHVMAVWFKPVIKDFPYYFEWLDKNDFRVGVRRFVHQQTDATMFRKVLRRLFPKQYLGKYKLEKYTEAERGYIYAYTCPKVTFYGLDLESSYGRPCTSGKDMILVKYNGDVALCADCYGKRFTFGNLFDPNFKLKTELTHCPTNSCGGDYGMLHMIDNAFGPNPIHLANDTFISIVEEVPQTSPVAYHHRKEMLEWLERLRRE